MQKLLAIRKYRITNPQSPIVGIAEDLSFHSKIRNSSKVLRRNFDRVCKIDLVYNARDVRHIARQDRSKRICIRYIVRCIAICIVRRNLGDARSRTRRGHRNPRTSLGIPCNLFTALSSDSSNSRVISASSRREVAKKKPCGSSCTHLQTQIVDSPDAARVVVGRTEDESASRIEVH